MNGFEEKNTQNEMEEATTEQIFENTSEIYNDPESVPDSIDTKDSTDVDPTSAGEDAAANEQQEPSLEMRIREELLGGSRSKLFKLISGVTIDCNVIKDSFCRFVEDIEIGDSFSVADILFGAEACLKQGAPDAKAGDGIYVFDSVVPNDKPSKKLLQSSVCGIYDLLCVGNGMLFDITDFGAGILSAQTKRFAVLSEKKAEKIFKKMSKQNIAPKKIGEVVSGSEVCFVKGDQVLLRVKKEELFDKTAKQSIKLSREHLADFVSGYRAVCSYSVCNTITKNNLLRFGLGGTMESVCARALGFYAAMMYTKILPSRLVFSEDAHCDVAVPRPSVSDGDYLYLLKLRLDENGLPDKTHHGQLNFYLSEMKKNGTIKDVLPQKENIINVIKRLCGDTLEYVTLSDIPQGCFGVIVSVPRGYSVNGIKIGYFKYI